MRAWRLGEPVPFDHFEVRVCDVLPVGGDHLLAALLVAKLHGSRQNSGAELIPFPHLIFPRSFEGSCCDLS